MCEMEGETPSADIFKKFKYFGSIENGDETEQNIHSKNNGRE